MHVHELCSGHARQALCSVCQAHQHATSMAGLLRTFTNSLSQVLALRLRLPSTISGGGACCMRLRALMPARLWGCRPWRGFNRGWDLGCSGLTFCSSLCFSRRSPSSPDAALRRTTVSVIERQSESNDQDMHRRCCASTANGCRVRSPPRGGLRFPSVDREDVPRILRIEGVELGIHDTEAQTAGAPPR